MRSLGETPLGACSPAMERNLRLHVKVGPECNNNCLFCMEDNRAARRAVVEALTPDRIRTILEEGRGAEEVCFTSGEPTLVPALVQYINWARQLGYPRISISTNGRRLAYQSYCDRLIRAGARHFYVSLHGHIARLHDGLTRTQGAFEQTVAGIRHVALRKSAGVGLHTCTAVTLRNLPHLRRIYHLVCSLGADQAVFNVLQPTGRAHKHFERIVPSYSAIVNAFASLLSEVEAGASPAFLVDIPPCLARRLPRRGQGWVEPYRHHEVVPVRGLDSSTTGSPPMSNERLIELRRADFDRDHRSKRPACATCRMDTRCPGVWDNYLAHFGWQEFHPIEQDP